jgi:hypothetical protein
MSEVSSGAAAYQPGVAKGVDGLDAKGFLHNDRIRAAAGMKPITKWGKHRRWRARWQRA